MYWRKWRRPMTETTFFRLLDVPIDDKGAALRAQIAALNGEARPPDAVALDESGDTFTVDPREFRVIPKSSFAYWIGASIRSLFSQLPKFEPEFGESRAGLQSMGANEIFIRTWWEVLPKDRGKTNRWVDFAKGGESITWYGDIHLVTEWEDDGRRQKSFASQKYNSVTRKIVGMDYYFDAGLTYTAYTNKGFHVRVMPKDCIYSLAGPGIFPNDWKEVRWILGVMNSDLMEFLIRLMTDRRKWEPGYVKALPFKSPSDDMAKVISQLAMEAHDLQRDGDRGDEVTHAFGVPDLVRRRAAPTLQAAEAALQETLHAQADRLAAIQAEINELTFDLYDLDADDRALVRAEVEQPPVAAAYAYQAGLEERVQDLLMWCVGVAFGRWDVRKALDPSRLPPLGDPFDPLPRCAPGALVGPDGLPLHKNAPPDAYPLPIAWDGVLVDDPANPSDIIRQTRGVLRLLWGARADAIEAEICEILDVATLRDYVRDYRHGFFDYHIKRYSKSRRKAPLYWLLQSERRNYALWLYYPRLETRLLYTAGRDYADVKINLERGHLEPLQQALAGLEGRARRQKERDIARQVELIEEMTEFRDTLDRIALQDLAFDLNDGVLINIAPLHALVPWKYAARTWKRLLKGEYAWSAMASQMRGRGLAP